MSAPGSEANASPRLPRVLLIAGLVALLGGAIDPLEGAPVILAGSVLVAVGTRLARAPTTRLATIALVLVVFGFGALFGLSAVGGVGGSSGQSTWLILLVVPFPIGWVMSLVAGVRTLRARRAE